MKDYQVPFDMNGNMCFYSGYSNNPQLIWRDNDYFQAKLKFLYVTAGRSAITFILEDTTSKCKYYMNLGNFETVLHQCELNNGEFYGEFYINKRGNYYSLVLNK